MRDGPCSLFNRFNPHRMCIADVHFASISWTRPSPSARTPSARFYKSAGVIRMDQDDPRTGTLRPVWALTLDGRLVRTPANKLLTLPTQNMAMAVALEFDVQDLNILPYTMPMTTLATTAIDQISRSDVRKSSITGVLHACVQACSVARAAALSGESRDACPLPKCVCCLHSSR